MPDRFCSTTTTSTPGRPSRMNRALRASSPHLAAHSTACLPTPPAPSTVTLMGSRSGDQKRRPATLEGVEGGGQPVARHVAQVLDQAPSVVAGDHVERDGLDAQAAAAAPRVPAGS